MALITFSVLAFTAVFLTFGSTSTSDLAVTILTVLVAVFFALGSISALASTFLQSFSRLLLQQFRFQ
ncbi:MAG: hypothetical protein HC846_10810 [Blastocatellia bacterium]|nr:hypothetical protein [Blastocatellia bacterium]